MIRILGCPAATWPDREVQVAELRQRHQLASLREWQDGISEVANSPEVPMVVLRYVENVNVATFNEGTPRPHLSPWARFFPATFPFGQCRTLGLNENAELRIGSTTYRASYALIDITEHEPRPFFDALAVYGTHLLDMARSVVAFGPPDQLDGIGLEWLQPPAREG